LKLVEGAMLLLLPSVTLHFPNSTRTTNAEQMEQGAVPYPDLESVENMATEGEIEALAVANAAEPAPLPSEQPYLFVVPRG